MKILTAAIVFAPLMLAGVLPAMAGPPVSLSPENAPARSATRVDAEADRTTYMQKTRTQLQEWQRKVSDYGAQSKDKGQAAGNAGGKELNKAWAKTQAASHQLRTASSDRWDGAKASYEKASRGLAETWHKYHPDEK